MRGKGNLPGARGRSRRITPAHAGKSHNRLGARSQCEDHPRPCGEKVYICAAFDRAIGSPPPMRGKEPLLLA